MIRRNRTLEDFELAYMKREGPDYRKNLKLVEAMLVEAIHLKVFPPLQPLEGIEVDIKIARVINSV